MTANHAHTPTDAEMQELFETGAMVTEFSHTRNEATIDWQLWLQGRDARIEAAAEQRGAVKALRDAAEAIEKNNIVFDGDHYQPCNSCMSIHMNWLDYRADQIEADDA